VGEKMSKQIPSISREEIIEIAKDTFSDCLKKLDSKGNDYAEDSNGLSSFVLAGEMSKSDTRTSLFNMIGIKHSRLIQLTFSDKEVKNESVEDTFNDYINYLVLAKSEWIASNQLKSVSPIKSKLK
jgi:hypothetical protein